MYVKVYINKKYMINLTFFLLIPQLKNYIKTDKYKYKYKTFYFHLMTIKTILIMSVSSSLYSTI